MRNNDFIEAQISGMFKEQKAGVPMAEVCRKHGLSQGTFYKSKSKYGCSDLSQFDAAALTALTAIKERNYGTETEG